MTIQKLIFNMKEDGWSDNAVRVGVCKILTDRNYKINETTKLVIEKYLTIYAQFASEVA